MTTREVLENARELISDEEHWCKGAFEKNRGKQYCAVGAVAYVAANPTTNTSYDNALNLLRQSVGGAIVAYNDSYATTHACILAAFDAALEKCDE